MAGRSGRVNRREAALAALIEAPNLRAAAQACNVPERTLRRWMTESAFRQRYESMRRDLISNAWHGLQERLSEASTTVAALMNDKSAPPQVRLGAARTVLEFALRSCEQLDILPRLEALEQAENDRQNIVRNWESMTKRVRRLEGIQESRTELPLLVERMPN